MKEYVVKYLNGNAYMCAYTCMARSEAEAVKKFRRYVGNYHIVSIKPAG